MHSWDAFVLLSQKTSLGTICDAQDNQNMVSLNLDPRDRRIGVKDQP